MKNVMFFTHHLWGGGAEKTVCSISNYINEHYDDITSYVCVVYDEPAIRQRVKNVIILNNKSDKDTLKIVKPFIIYKQIKELKKIKKEKNIDTCISFLPGADLINVSSGIGEKQIVSVRNVESYFLTNPFKKSYDKYSYKRCDLIVAVTENVKKDLIDNFGVEKDKIVTIYNAINEMPKDQPCIREFEEFIKNKYVFINVARLAPEKSQDILIKAFAKVFKSDEKVGLVIVGGGSEESKLKTLSKQLGIEKNVLFTGKQHNPYDYMKKSDAFVLSSRIEGMPNTLLEAMQCGLPCIATDTAAGEILSPSDYNKKIYTCAERTQYGIVVPSENSNELAIAMQKIVSEKNNSESTTSYLNSFHIEKVVEKWIEVI